MPNSLSTCRPCKRTASDTASEPSAKGIKKASEEAFFYAAKRQSNFCLSNVLTTCGLALPLASFMT